MAKVSLRIYNREIESLIDQGNTDEAIAHCHHILQTFSKHLETYRLLGKAFLEAKRSHDAVDIFSRVLMAVPDDFVAHVGMSIIRDDENKLDDAIWHMERAFEAQPSNSAIQGELQRLYGRRDGMEPPKIRMTRGALAHMYMQGELYAQAISEIRAVLSEDLQRADMQVLLANAYFRSGQKADASDMCAQLLKRYPYCFDANRILVELLPGSESAESTQVYRHRVYELDPYATFAKESVFRSNEVPDASINLERLEYSGQAVDLKQDWGASLGIGLASVSSTSNEQPDWLKTEMSESEPDTRPAPVSQAQEDIPDFLRKAGWAESNGAVEEPSALDSAPADELAPADLPDWLKNQMPSESQSSPPETASPAAESPDWPSGFSGAQSADFASSSNEPSPVELPDWLQAQAPSKTEPSPSLSASPAAESPDWLSGLGGAQSADLASSLNGPSPVELPDWLKDQMPSETMPLPARSASPVAESPDWSSGLNGAQSADLASTSNEPSPVELPDWLKDQMPSGTIPLPARSASPVAESPDWLNGLEDAHPAESTPSSSEPLPDWLSGLGGSQPEEASAPASSSAQDIPGWLAGLDTSDAGQVEESVVKSTPASQADSFISEIPSPNKESAMPEPMQTIPPQPESSKPVPQPASLGTPLGPSAKEQDDALGWLEMLAAKHGAKQEEMVSDPALRTEKPPEWVEQARMGAEPQSVAPVPAETPVQSETPVTDETGMWLRDLEEKDAVSQTNAAEPLLASAQDLPDWLRDMKPEPVAPQPETAAPQSAVPEWLSGLEDESVVKDIPDVQPVTEEPLPQQSELPEWLSKIQNESAAQNLPDAQPVSVEPLPQQDVSDWLSGLDKEAESSDQFATEPKEEPVASKPSDMPEWLSGLKTEPVSGVEDQENIYYERNTMKLADLSETVESDAAKLEPADLPEWLRGLDETQPSRSEAKPDALPAWLQNESEIEEEQSQAEPAEPSDWHPAEPKTEPTAWKSEVDYESRPPAAALQPVAPTSEIRLPVPPPPDVRKPAPRPAAAQKPAPRSRKAVESPQESATVLTQAQGELNRGDIPTALNHYNKLVKKGKNLDETIRDLRDSLYRYPVEVSIWQALGDAYMRANRLQEALDAYNKAEELIR